MNIHPNTHVLISEEPDNSFQNRDLNGLVGEVVNINTDDDKALVNPKYRVKQLYNNTDDPMRSERFWISIDRLVKVLKRKDTVQVSGHPECVMVDGANKSNRHFGIKSLH